MSESNLQLIEEAFSSFKRGDMDAVRGALHQEVEMPGAVGGLEEGEITRGREAVAEQLVRDASVWDESRYIVQELVEVDDRVVALVHEQRRGRGSGVEIGADHAFVYSFKDGKVFRLEPYMDQAAALHSARRPN